MSSVASASPVPTSAIVPSRPSARVASAITAGIPVVSNAEPAPPPVRSAIAATTSFSRGSSACVAPSSSASSRRPGTGSTTIAVSTPRCTAAISPASPTPPAPKTANEEPAAGFSTLRTAPAPVWMPQPSGAATVRSRPGSTFTVLLA